MQSTEDTPGTPPPVSPLGEGEMFDALIYSLPVRIYFKDRDSRFLRCSRDLAIQLGFNDPSEVEGKTDFDLFTDEHANAARADEVRIMESGTPVECLLEKETWKDGHITWVQTTKLPLRNTEGEIVGIFGVSTDVTARIEAEEQIKNSEAFYTSLVENLPQMIFRKDIDGKITFANNRFCEAIGLSQADIIGKSDADLFPLEFAQKYRADDLRVIGSGEPLECEERFKGPDGDARYTHVVKTPLRNHEGTVVGVQGIFWDITQRKRQEQELANAHKELVDISRMAGMAEIATGVLHNVGNVLNSVNISANIVAEAIRNSRATSLTKLVDLLDQHRDDLGTFMTENPKGQKIPTFISTLAEHVVTEQKQLLDEVASLKKNVDHIKEIVAMQQGYATVSGVTETLDVEELMEDALRMNAASLNRHEVNVVKEVEQVPMINVQKHKVLQILVNLISNAKHAIRDANQTQGQITLAIRKVDEGRISLSVCDNGCGMTPETLGRIFQHGFTTKQSGHGFGLHSGAIAVKEMGGEIKVDSDGVGKGAQFTLILPVAPPSDS